MTLRINLERIWRESGKNLARICRESGKNMARIWRESGENLARIWRESGENLAKDSQNRDNKRRKKIKDGQKQTNKQKAGTRRLALAQPQIYTPTYVS